MTGCVAHSNITRTHSSLEKGFARPAAQFNASDRSSCSRSSVDRIMETAGRSCWVETATREARCYDVMAMHIPLGRHMESETMIESAFQTLMQRAKDRCALPGGPTALSIVTVDGRGAAEIGVIGQTGGPGSAPASADTWFRLGSISKILVAFAVLNFCEQNGVDVDAPITPDLAPGRGGASPRASLRSLLSHTAGLCNGAALADPAPGGPAQWLRVVGMARSRFSYSNLGYALLGHWMGVRTGLRTADWLQRFACLPLGIEGVAFQPPGGASAAAGHVWDPQRKCREPFTVPFGDERLAPAGFLWASPRGVATLVKALLHPPSERLDQIVRRMSTPQSEAIGLAGVSYGLGLFTYRVGDRRIAFHDGEIAGFQAFVEFDLARRMGTGILANMSGPERIARTVLGGQAPVPPRARRESRGYRRLLGTGEGDGFRTFAAPSLGVVQVSLASSSPVANLNGVAFTLEPVEENAFKGDVDGQVLILKSSSELSQASYAYVNGQLAPAIQLRVRQESKSGGVQFDPAWLGRYWNGYWIDVYAAADGRLRIASNYSGTDSMPLVLGRRCLATDLGIMLFTRRSGRRSLRLLGVNWFRQGEAPDPPVPLAVAT